MSHARGDSRGGAPGRVEQSERGPGRTAAGRTPSVEDILWGIPEQKTGALRLLGGNSQSFSTEIRTAEFLNTLPLKTVRLTLPDALRPKLPPAGNLDFLPSTPSGSFAKSAELRASLNSEDFNLLLGDFSKNSATAIALADALIKSEKPALLTRDTIDLLAAEAQNLLLKNNLILFASLPQLQKLFRACYYPKMLLLSMPLLPVVETLHKFTLSYPVTIITFHSENLIFANNGKTETMKLEKTSYSPLSLWTGTLAAKIATLNLWTPNKPLEASLAALSYNPSRN